MAKTWSARVGSYMLIWLLVLAPTSLWLQSQAEAQPSAAGNGDERPLGAVRSTSHDNSTDTVTYSVTLSEPFTVSGISQLSWSLEFGTGAYEGGDACVSVKRDGDALVGGVAAGPCGQPVKAVATIEVIDPQVLSVRFSLPPLLAAGLSGDRYRYVLAAQVGCPPQGARCEAVVDAVGPVVHELGRQAPGATTVTTTRSASEGSAEAEPSSEPASSSAEPATTPSSGPTAVAAPKAVSVPDSETSPVASPVPVAEPAVGGSAPGADSPATGRALAAVAPGTPGDGLAAMAQGNCDELLANGDHEAYELCFGGGAPAGAAGSQTTAPSGGAAGAPVPSATPNPAVPSATPNPAVPSGMANPALGAAGVPITGAAVDGFVTAAGVAIGLGLLLVVLGRGRSRPSPASPGTTPGEALDDHLLPLSPPLPSPESGTAVAEPAAAATAAGPHAGSPRRTPASEGAYSSLYLELLESRTALQRQLRDARTAACAG